MGLSSFNTFLFSFHNAEVTKVNMQLTMHLRNINMLRKNLCSIEKEILITTKLSWLKVPSVSTYGSGLAMISGSITGLGVELGDALNDELEPS